MRQSEKKRGNGGFIKALFIPEGRANNLIGGCIEGVEDRIAKRASFKIQCVSGKSSSIRVKGRGGWGVIL